MHRACLLSGLLGSLFSGGMTFCLINYFSTVVNRPVLSDAVSIADTYIVFTTIIFVAITLFLTGAGLWFTQQFAASKELQIKHLVAEIEHKLRQDDDQLGIGFVDHALANPDVTRYIQENLQAKLEQLVNDFRDRANSNKMAVDELSKELNSGDRS